MDADSIEIIVSGVVTLSFLALVGFIFYLIWKD